MKSKELINLDFYHTKKKDLPDIYQARRQLAKVANQRMVRLERAVSEISGNKYTFGAYEIAQDYLEATRPTKITGAYRFSENLKQANKSTEDILHEIAVLQSFLASKSSRVGGQKEIEKERMETFKSMGVTEVSSLKEFYDFLNSQTFEYLKKHGYDSDDLVEMYEKSYEDGEKPSEIQKKFDEFLESGAKSFKELVSKFDAYEIGGSSNK